MKSVSHTLSECVPVQLLTPDYSLSFIHHSDVTDVISADTFKRPMYAGNAIATVTMTDKIKVHYSPCWWTVDGIDVDVMEQIL